MKKLMFAAAAIAAGVAMADVTSANIVGYLHKGLTPIGGTKLVSASFSEINADGVKMADLKPEGYLNNSFFIGENGGTWGDFGITFLNEGGDAIGAYGWEQAYENGQWGEGRWVEYQNDMGEGYFDVIPVGMSMFFSSPTPEEGENYTLPTSGEVVTKKVDFELPEGTCQWGNPRATTISINDLVPTGYLNNDYFIGENGGTWGDFGITFLNEGGDTIGAYGWEQPYENDQWGEGRWVEYEPAESTDLEAGDGVFVTGAYHSGDEGTPYYITLPKQEL